MSYTEINENKWDKWVSEKCVWTMPITQDEYREAKEGREKLFLTPLKPVPRDWYLPLSGKRVLGLASGGGQQCPIMSACGAEVTVFDISSRQLEMEKYVADREKYHVELIKGDMTLPFPFESESFDMIFHPVSNSYIEDIGFVWKECFRVLKQGGVLLAGFANPTIYLFDFQEDSISEELTLMHTMPYKPCINELTGKYENRVTSDGLQFGHSFAEQIGGQLSVGFVLTGFYEDYHIEDNSKNNYHTFIGEIASRLTRFMPVYFASRAVKR